MPTLFGRRAERAALETLLTSVRGGRSGTLVFTGQAGIGKSALLDYAEAFGGTDFRVERCVGVESEAQFAFAGLHQLCALMLEHAGRLTDAQREALAVAFGLRSGPAPDLFLVGLATLSLMAEAAQQEPLLCLVDDAQWIDEASAQVLAFVARRLTHEAVAMVVARRDPAAEEIDWFADLSPRVRVTGLADTDALALLATGTHAPLDERVRDRIIAEARGNPLALLELPASAPLSDLAGGFELPDALGAPRRIQDGFRRRSAGLSRETQRLLLLAAAEPTGDVALLWRAAESLGTPRSAVTSAEESGLLEIGTRVRFRHPLVRSAVYTSAAQGERRRAHRALAEATDPRTDPDRRTWHRAQGVEGMDEDAAAELELAAERSRARGGVAAAAAFLRRATELTPDPAARARRALASAHASHDAGASAAAGELLVIAEMGPLDALQRARADLLRARIAFQLTEGDDVPGMLLSAAARLSPLDPGLARETYLHALDASMIIGGPGDGRRVNAIAEAARAAPASPGSPSPPDLLLDGLVLTIIEGHGVGAPAIRRALTAFREHGFDGEATGEMGSRRWLGLATRTAAAFFEDELGHVLAERSVRLAREAGALATLPLSLVALSANLVLAGQMARAAELAQEGTAITRATGALNQPYAHLFVAAWRGDHEQTVRLAATSLEKATETGAAAASARYALAVLNNGEGSYAAARDAAALARQTDELVTISLALPELVEAAVRAGDVESAQSALEELVSLTSASGTPWATGLGARSRALTITGAAAEASYLEAIDELGRSGMAGHLARTHLVYGEWLRKQGRRRDARDQLRTAYEMLAEMGADAFAGRAARELRATGEHPRKRTAEVHDGLTDREAQIARLVAEGATSREVGAQLFLSPRTIDAHLRNIFHKLGISSRRELRTRMTGSHTARANSVD